MTGVRPVALVVSPDLIVSPMRVSYQSQTPEAGVFTWAYARAGAYVDLGGFLVGLSAACRTTTFAEQFAVELPVAGGLEARWVVPSTPLVLTAALAAEAESAESYYILGGIGLAVLD